MNGRCGTGLQSWPTLKESRCRVVEQQKLTPPLGDVFLKSPLSNKPERSLRVQALAVHIPASRSLRQKLHSSAVAASSAEKQQLTYQLPRLKHIWHNLVKGKVSAVQAAFAGLYPRMSWNVLAFRVLWRKPARFAPFRVKSNQ